jgi:hypothetical protein
VSEGEEDGDSEGDRKAFGCLADAAGCGAEGCFTFALPSLLLVLFLFLR